MKKLILLFAFVAINCSAQTTMFEIKNSHQQTVFKITDVDAHYHSGVALSGWGASSFYYLTNRPLLSSIVGAVFGTTCGILKEKVWDGAWHNGVDNPTDMIWTGSGSFVVVLHFNVYIMSTPVREDKKAKPTDPFLN